MISKIEWCDRSDWNPIRGCTRVSPGCGGPGPHGGCYAEAKRTKSGPRWTGKIEVKYSRIDLPLRWRKPATIFASSTSDWFHEALPVDEIANLYAVAVAAVHVRGHRILILTKRAQRAREILNSSEAFWEQVNAEAGAHVMEHTDPLNRTSGDARAACDDDYGPSKPPPGIWLGVSVEDQARADERIPLLLDTPAAKRFVSAEPLLGPVDLRRWIAIDWHCSYCREFFTGPHTSHCPSCGKEGGWTGSGIDWVIGGGESGPNARPMHPDWARELRDQCQDSGVPFFFKQWGEWVDAAEPHGYVGRLGPDRVRLAHPDGFVYPIVDGNPGFPDSPTLLHRVGKKAAGRLLDGREWNEVPE